MIPAPQLGWMAGILDLKGRVLYKNNQRRAPGSRQMVLAVDSTQITIIRELARMTGTHPELKKVQEGKEGWWRKSCEQHCDTAHVHVTPGGPGDFPASARWTITGTGMVIVMHNVLPFMRSDHGFPEIMEEAMDQAKINGRGSPATLNSIRRLMGLGWELPEELKTSMERKLENEEAAA
jgi:hypothetical protein